MTNKKVYIETYGCQMNVNDSEVVLSILEKENYILTDKAEDADFVLINTCSIRENAEQKIHSRVAYLNSLRKKNANLKIGIIGCMAERVQNKFFDKGQVNLVAGPDSYRNLPELIKSVENNINAIDVYLSNSETYDTILPERMDPNGVSAFISIMRGCNNFCSYCIVPYTRGRERSRDPKSILIEAEDAIAKGYKEITLLGQNVNSYKYNNGEVNFPMLLAKVAKISNDVRIRFATSHPKDISDELIEVIAQTNNICNSIHLPVQSGSSNVLKNMNRKYDREWYLNRINKIKKEIPDCAITTDIITGFPGETEIDHSETISIMKEVGYDYAYMFKYSERPGTFAADNLNDDVPEEIKTRRLNEIIKLQNELSLKSNKKDIGKKFQVLIEGISKKSEKELFGRTSQNKVVVFPNTKNLKTGEYTTVIINDCTSATLKGKIV